MAGPCPTVADTLSRQLGGFTCDAPAGVHLRSPFELSNWTLPVLELAIVLGAVLALGHAVRRLRREGDPTNLVLLGAGIAYLAVIEPPLYFPNIFGLQDITGVAFVHNVFTVDFLYDRLPLYIVALYLALPMLAFEIVRTLGVFRRRGALLGAICVGAVHGAFYEVFDQLGPQLRWWIWNPGSAPNHPFLASVPMGSVTLYATLSPAVLVYLVYRLVTLKVQRGERIGAPGYVWRTVLPGVLVPVIQVIGGAPVSLLGGDHPHRAGQAAVYAVELAGVWAVAVPVLVSGWRQERRHPSTGPNWYVQVFGTGYLLVFAVLWGTALPALLDAVRGVTRDGTPIGSLTFAVACYLAAVALVAAVGAGVPRRGAIVGTRVVPGAATIVPTAGSG